MTEGEPRKGGCSSWGDAVGFGLDSLHGAFQHESQLLLTLVVNANSLCL